MSGRYAVVGHVEWVEFARVPRLPGLGEVVHAADVWREPGGGAAVAAVQLARLAGGADLFTALPRDDGGARGRLESLGVRVHAAERPGPMRRCFAHVVEGSGERTITVLGSRMMPSGDDPLPWELLDGADGVYFTLGDAAALHAARRGRLLVAIPRAHDVLAAAGVPIDALVRSGSDPAEQFDIGSLDLAPSLVVTTESGRGGRWADASGEGRYEPAALPGPRGDAYGPGDCFAAAFTYGLGAGLGRDAALALAARAGAHKLAGRAPFEGMLGLDPPIIRG
jgi:ribokinase